MKKIKKIISKIIFFMAPNSLYKKFSEDFIEDNAETINWCSVSCLSKLSESFIEKHADKVNWDCISEYQHLSESFIEKYTDKVDWYCISAYQHLSESFIEKHTKQVNWYRISKYQYLSESFIEKHADELDHYYISASWHYKSEEYKKQQVIDTGMYECHDDYFIAYKGIRSDRYSNYNFQYQYLKDETYECFANCSDNENSFGLSAWTKEEAEEYCNELVVRVKIYYKDVARVVHGGGKIRCSKLTVLD